MAASTNVQKAKQKTKTLLSLVLAILLTLGREKDRM